MKLLVVILVIALIIILALESNKIRCKKELEKTYAHIKTLNKNELSKFTAGLLHDDLGYYILESNQTPNKHIPIDKRKYGCITYIDAGELYDTAVERHNMLLYKEKAETAAKKEETAKAKSRKEKYEKITEFEKQQLLKTKGEEDLSAVLYAFNKAIKGDAEAMALMGYTYNLTLKDPVKSAYWLEKASKAGDSEAMYHLGTYYMDGYGVTQNKVQGTSLILEAAKAGNDSAIECLIEKFNMSKNKMREYGIQI